MDIELDRETIWDGIGGVSFHVRSSNFDIVLVTLGLGTIFSLLLLFFVYIMVRKLRSKGTSNLKRSKADRPSWVFGLILAGSSWIFSTLLVTGSLVIEPEILQTCAIVRYVGQYLFGFIFWIALVNYKLIRKYFQLRIVNTKAPHALLALAIQIVPYLIFVTIASFYEPCSRNFIDVCMGETNWMWFLYGILIPLVLIFLFCIIKIRKTIGAHHEVIRYTIFLITSFLFPFIDGIIQLSPVSFELMAHQIMVTFVILIVLGNMAHIFILILRRKSTGKTTGVLPETSLRSPGAVLSISSLSEVEPIDLQNAALNDLNAMLTDGKLQGRPIPPPPVDTVILMRPSRTSPIQPQFEQYLDYLNEEENSQIDRGRGYFLNKKWNNSSKSRKTIVEFDLQKAFKYLDMPYPTKDN